MHEFDTFADIKNENGKIAIFSHDNPDPDSMGAALGIKWLLKKKYKIDSDIFYGGRISQGMNTTMVNVLAINMLKSDEYDSDIYEKVIFVDTVSKIAMKITADAVIDHHNVNINPGDYEFSLIEKAGSCCTLIYNLMKELKCLPESEDGEEPTVATAMFYGLVFDSKNLKSKDTTSADDEVFSSLRRNSDMEKVRLIENFPKPRYFYTLLGELMRDGNHVIEKTTLIGFLGYMPEAQEVAIPMIADEILLMEGITTTIVCGIIEDNMKISVRSTDISIDLKTFCQKLFGNDGGVKGGVAGWTVPLGFLGDTPNVPDDVKDKVSEALKLKLLHLVKAEVKSE
jgi:nanoRNase/pAp phosphatase (c-di-AMP/oligoRNAs hydrolase)